MQKRIKNTVLFSLWLAMGFFFLHAVIPHGQHTYGSFSSVYRMTTGYDDTGRIPLACHLSEDLSFDRSDAGSVKSANILTDNFHPAPVVFHNLQAERLHPQYVLSVADRLIPRIFSVATIPVRGSPSFI